MCFFKKRKARKEAAQKMKEAEQAQNLENKVVEEKVMPVEEKVVPVEEETPVAKKAVVEEKKTLKVEEEKNVEDEDTVVKYHVSQNKKENTAHYKEWRVRKAGSTKTIKYFNTQADAIEYAKTLAENQNSSIVIHKVDGTLRKQDYSKK